MRTPDVRTNGEVVRLLVVGVDVEVIAKKFNFTKRTLVQRIRRYPDLVYSTMKEHHPVKLTRILDELGKKVHPNTIAANHELSPTLVYALLDWSKSQ